MFSKTFPKLALAAVLALGTAAFADETAPAAAATPPAAAAKAAPAKAAKAMSFTGTVVSTDAIANTLVVKGAKAEETFSVSPTGKILMGKKELKLADVQKDSKATVKYTEENGQKTAATIKVSMAPAAKKETKTAATP